ncbi:TolC family protein [Taibaiella lutea]|nr:TolC family protein [Taibaiella lutea]
MFKRISLLILLFTATLANAQDGPWTLQKTIQYALENNIDIKQNVLNERLAALQLQQSKLSQLPNASINTDVGRSYGRSVDPTTNLFINQGYSFFGLNGNVDVLLFGWFQKRSTIAQNNLLNKAATADLDQLKDDVSLNVATAFLRILMTKEQITIQEGQLLYSNKQKDQTKSFVESGRSPDLDLAQMEAQVATDSSAYYTAIANYQQAILDMKAIMNFDIAAPFDVIAPQVEDLPLNEISSVNPEDVYLSAQNHFGSVKSSQLKLDAAKKGLDVNKGALYPQLSATGQFGTNYASTLKELTSANITGSQPNGDFISVNNQVVPVLTPTYDYLTRTTPFGSQFSNNFRHTYALTLSVPLFNGWNTRTAISRSKIDIASKNYALESTKLKLKQDVYKAYYDAKVSVQKYYASKKADEASERAYNYAQQRYELGLMNAVELLTTQNNSLKAKSEALSAKYDMVFKLKVIDYYLGKEIKL